MLVIITIFRFMDRETVINLFIANLSFGDTLVIGFALPLRVSFLGLSFFGPSLKFFQQLVSLTCIFWILYCLLGNIAKYCQKGCLQSKIRET